MFIKNESDILNENIHDNIFDERLEEKFIK